MKHKVIRNNKTLSKCLGILTMQLLASSVSAQSSSGSGTAIDNELNTGAPGFLSVDVLAGGESFDARFTAIGNPSGNVIRNTDFLFNYGSQIDVGGLGNAFSLGSTSRLGPTLVNAGFGDDEVVSSGTFSGSAGARVDWAVSSVIADGSGTLTNTYTFSARSGTLGEIRFYQFIDQDVLGSNNDVFFTRGDVANGTLELFTIDNNEAIGLSQSGALNNASGLSSATFSGWAACTFPSISNSIANGSQRVSLTGEVCNQLQNNAIDHPVVGPAFGPLDIVSALAWNVDPNSSNATIITTMNISNPQSSPISTATCEGLPVTVNLALGQSPTSGNDVILGTEGADNIRALGGDDIICALGGNDVINAGGGDDIVRAGSGNDRVFGNAGDDALFGGPGGDQLFGGSGEDMARGGAGNDRLNGGAGDDLLYGENGNDRVFGQAGNDVLFGGRGSDRLVGDSNTRQAGDDVLDGGPGADQLIGRAGNDSCTVDSADTQSDCS